MEIKEQKKVADRVLDMIYPIDPNAIVAGGAPRNWFMGLPANDIDVYFHHHSATTGAVTRMLRHVGLNVEEVNPDAPLPEMYKTLPNLRKVYRCSVGGMSVDLMFMGAPTFEGCVENFGASISKAWYKGGRIQGDADFYLSVKTKTIVLDEGYNHSDKYIKKVCTYFPDFNIVSKETQLKILAWDAVNEIKQAYRG